MGVLLGGSVLIGMGVAVGGCGGSVMTGIGVSVGGRGVFVGRAVLVGSGVGTLTCTCSKRSCATARPVRSK